MRRRELVDGLGHLRRLLLRTTDTRSAHAHLRLSACKLIANVLMRPSPTVRARTDSLLGADSLRDAGGCRGPRAEATRVAAAALTMPLFSVAT